MTKIAGGVNKNGPITDRPRLKKNISPGGFTGVVSLGREGGPGQIRRVGVSR